MSLWLTFCSRDLLSLLTALLVGANRDFEIFKCHCPATALTNPLELNYNLFLFAEQVSLFARPLHLDQTVTQFCGLICSAPLRLQLG